MSERGRDMSQSLSAGEETPSRSRAGSIAGVESSEAEKNLVFSPTTPLWERRRWGSQSQVQVQARGVGPPNPVALALGGPGLAAGAASTETGTGSGTGTGSAAPSSPLRQRYDNFVSPFASSYSHSTYSQAQQAQQARISDPHNPTPPTLTR